MGIDQQTGQARLTFGSPELLDGMELVVVMVGLFAVGETIYVASRYGGGGILLNPLAGGLWMTREDWRRSWKPWLRGTLIGFPIGALPAGGSEIPTFSRYTIERRLSPQRRSSAARARSRAWPGPRRPTTPRRPESWSAPDARPTDLRDRGDPARGVPELRPPARAASHGEVLWVGVDPDREPLHR